MMSASDFCSHCGAHRFEWGEGLFLQDGPPSPAEIREEIADLERTITELRSALEKAA